LTIFYIHFAIHLINQNLSFHGKHNNCLGDPELLNGSVFTSSFWFHRPLFDRSGSLSTSIWQPFYKINKNSLCAAQHPNATHRVGNSEDSVAKETDTSPRELMDARRKRRVSSTRQVGSGGTTQGERNECLDIQLYSS